MMAIRKAALISLGISQNSLFFTNQQPISGQIRKKLVVLNARNISKTPQSRTTPFTRKNIVQSPFERANFDAGGGKSSIPGSALIKPLVFTVAFSTGSLIGASIWEYETIRAQARKSIQNSTTYAWLKTRLNQKNNSNMSDWRKEVKDWWSKLTPGERVFVPLCTLNMIVFGLWRIPRLQPTMMKYFCSNPAARAVCWPMFLSTFSHYSMFHIFANMFVLHSFSNAAVTALGREQFIGLYLGAGVISSFASYIYKVFTKQPGLSLGASGAIMAILALVCASYPDIQLSIILLPMYTFSAGSAIKVIIGFDLAGCILGWKFFDHAAHLGGALFGLFWCYLGSDLIWPQREYFLRLWHQMRSPKQ